MILSPFYVQNTVSIRFIQEKISVLLSNDPLTLKSKKKKKRLLLKIICSEDLDLKYLGNELFLRFLLTILVILNQKLHTEPNIFGLMKITY